MNSTIVVAKPNTFDIVRDELRDIDILLALFVIDF
jgi:hypothetical protein